MHYLFIKITCKIYRQIMKLLKHVAHIQNFLSSGEGLVHLKKASEKSSYIAFKRNCKRHFFFMHTFPRPKIRIQNLDIHQYLNGRKTGNFLLMPFSFFYFLLLKINFVLTHFFKVLHKF